MFSFGSTDDLLSFSVFISHLLPPNTTIIVIDFLNKLKIYIINFSNTWKNQSRDILGARDREKTQCCIVSNAYLAHVRIAANWHRVREAHGCVKEKQEREWEGWVLTPCYSGLLLMLLIIWIASPYLSFYLCVTIIIAF